MILNLSDVLSEQHKTIEEDVTHRDGEIRV